MERQIVSNAIRSADSSASPRSRFIQIDIADRRWLFSLAGSGCRCVARFGLSGGAQCRDCRCLGNKQTDLPSLHNGHVCSAHCTPEARPCCPMPRRVCRTGPDSEPLGPIVMPWPAATRISTHLVSPALMQGIVIIVQGDVGSIRHNTPTIDIRKSRTANSLVLRKLTRKIGPRVPSLSVTKCTSSSSKSPGRGPGKSKGPHGQDARFVPHRLAEAVVHEQVDHMATARMIEAQNGVHAGIRSSRGTRCAANREREHKR